MERVHFKEVVKIVNELKYTIEHAKAKFFVNPKHSVKSEEALRELEAAENKLEFIRNTKVSELHYLFK